MLWMLCIVCILYYLILYVHCSIDTNACQYVRIKKPLNVLKIKDTCMFKVKILKFYYKLSYGLLPKYFNSYIHKLEEEPVRVLHRNIIHPPLIKRVYAECNLLF